MRYFALELLEAKKLAARVQTVFPSTGMSIPKPTDRYGKRMLFDSTNTAGIAAQQPPAPIARVSIPKPGMKQVYQSPPPLEPPAKPVAKPATQSAADAQPAVGANADVVKPGMGWGKGLALAGAGVAGLGLLNSMRDRGD